MTPRPARLPEFAAALDLLLQHLPPADRPAHVRHLHDLVAAGSPDPAGLWVVPSDDGAIVGAALAERLPGAGGLVWPPRAVAGESAVEGALVRAVCGWLRGGGARLAQAFVLPEDLPRAGPLARNGFAHVTAVWTMALEVAAETPPPAPPRSGEGSKTTSPEQAPAHDLRSPFPLREGGWGVRLQLHADCDPALFRDTLLATYHGTLDCPELNGLRTPDEVMAGYLADAAGPRHWWLARDADDRPVGVLLLADGADPESWDVAYVGVVPEARGKGVGRGLMLHAIAEAKAANRRKLGLVVDARNAPAIRLYTSLGFKPCGCREVFLSAWPG